jgi:Xaa-Pro dipeptidase
MGNGDWIVLETFSETEFDRRLALVEHRLDRAGLDGLVVTSIANLPYLAGDPIGYMTNAGATLGLTAAVIARGQVRMMVRIYDGDSARWKAPGFVTVHPYSGDAAEFRAPPEVLADHLRDMGLESSRVGFEFDLPGLTICDLARLREILPNMRPVDASEVIVACSVIKSDEELEVMEAAAGATDAACTAIFSKLAEGVRERDLASAALQAMIEAGSQYPIFHPFVTSGARTALAHAGWSDKAIARGEPLFVEISGSVLRYHAPVIRTGLVGESAEVEEVYDVCEEAFQSALRAMKPGALAGDVDRASRDVITRRGFSFASKLRTGYQIGVDWSTRGAFRLMPDSKEELQPNMAFHVIPLLQIPGKMAVGCSESVLVTDDGARILSNHPRKLYRA